MLGRDANPTIRSGKVAVESIVVPSRTVLLWPVMAFGAMKVTYFNVIHKICRQVGANFDNVKAGAFLTGYIEKQHTLVPGPDGKFGFGGKCFPENVSAMGEHLRKIGMVNESELFTFMSLLNLEYRHLKGAG